MEWNVRLAVAMAVSLIGAVVAGLTVWWAATQPTNYQPQQVPVAQRPVVREVPPVGVHLRGGEALEARARIDALQQRLRQQTRLVALKNRELQDMREAIRQLRVDLADSLNQATLAELELLATPPESPRDNAAEPPAEASPSAQPSAQSGLDEELQAAELELSLEEANARAAQLEAVLANRRSAKLAALKRIGPAAVDGLIEALESPRVEVRLWACDALADLGQDAMEAEEALRMLLDDSDAEVRVRATVALQRIRE